MVRRNTIILLAVFLVLLGGVIYLNQDSNAQMAIGMITPTPTGLPKLITGYNFSDLKTVEYSNSDGSAYTFSMNQEGLWFTDKKEQVNLSSIFQVVEYMLDFKNAGELDKATSLDQVGLSSPKAKIVLVDSKNVKSVLLIGNLTAAQTDYYVQWNDNPISIVSSGSIDSLLQVFSPEYLIQPTPSASPTVTQ